MAAQQHCKGYVDTALDGQQLNIIKEQNGYILRYLDKQVK
jgi:hypothetical protein